MSGIMQRRPITLYETLEALYQQVNAPFCAQRREKFLARAARRCAPRQVRQLEEQMRPAADTARQELAALAARMQPSYDRWEGYFAGHTFAQLLESMTNQAVEEDGLENRVNLSLLAGTIAGNPADGTISGVAPQAQLVVMKVFGDKSTGAAEDDILAALEDCVKLGVDAVNLSVGTVSSYTFSKLTTGHTIRAEFESITFTVTFVDGITGETLDTQTVAYGRDTAAPQAPQHEGCTFSGWDAAFTNVRSDLTVTAQYDKNSEPTTPDQPEPGQPDQPDEGKQDDKPTTGDSFSAGWLALTLFSGAMATCMVLLRRKKAN